MSSSNLQLQCHPNRDTASLLSYRLYCELKWCSNIQAAHVLTSIHFMQEVRTRLGRPALVLEVSRLQCGAECTSSDVAGLAEQYRAWGADAVAVITDNSPSGLGDLFATCRALQSIPVLQRDWFLHPLQVTF